ncbi:hypothetical protein [Flavobacterium sp. ZS1P14]|uniref:hypothetical protein n=1 Tax=Flavobacterium sp. ZS1P14 TaxID=3401729 RepID=UPI003AAC0F5C
MKKEASDDKIISVDFKEARRILGLSKGAMLKYEKANKLDLPDLEKETISYQTSIGYSN